MRNARLLNLLPPLVPALALAVVLLHSSFWLPGVALPWTPLVSGSLVLVWLAARRSVWTGAAVAAALIAVCALASPPEVHLWGDGALRMRNLAAGIPLSAGGRFEPLDTLIHQLLVGAGTGPRESFVVTGMIGAAAYLAGAAMLARRAGEGTGYGAMVLTLLLTPVWTVFFTGYVESYALTAGMLMLFSGLLAAGASPLAVASCALLAASLHLLGLLLVPAAVLYAAERKDVPAVLTAAVAVPAALFWLLKTGGQGGAPALAAVASPGPLARLGIAVFAVPALFLVLPLVSRKPGRAAAVNAAVWLAAFLLFPMERGATRDWDVGSLMLLPVFAAPVACIGGRRSVVICVTAGAVILAGPGTGSFLDRRVSMERFEMSVEMSEDPGAVEELAISRRDEGRFTDAARLFQRAFDLSGNGRHLAQESEALRLAGLHDEALRTALVATELRPDVETAWLQLALAARDGRDLEQAVLAASGHEALFPGGISLWHIALETAVPDGDPLTAWHCAEKALEAPDTLVTVLVNAGTAAWMNGYSGLAIERYLQASDMDPSMPLPLYNLGMVMLATGDTLSARWYLEMALSVDGSFSPATEVLATLR